MVPAAGSGRVPQRRRHGVALGQRRGSGVRLGAVVGRRGAHGEVDRRGPRELVVRDRDTLVPLTVDGELLHVDVLLGVRRSVDDEVALGAVHGRLGELRRPDGPLGRADLERIEAERGEGVPGRLLAVVLVARVALADVATDVEAAQDLAHLLGGPVLLAGPVVHVGDVVRDLVAHPEHAHPDVTRLDDLVDDPAVAAGLGPGLRSREELVELVGHGLATSEEVGEAVAVVRSVEGEVPPVGLGVAATPDLGVEVRRELTVGRTHPQEAGLGVEVVRVRRGPLEEVLGLLLERGLPCCRDAGVGGELRGLVADAEVVDESLEAPGDALVRAIRGEAEERRRGQSLAADTGGGGSTVAFLSAAS